MVILTCRECGAVLHLKHDNVFAHKHNDPNRLKFQVPKELLE